MRAVCDCDCVFLFRFIRNARNNKNRCAASLVSFAFWPIERCFIFHLWDSNDWLLLGIHYIIGCLIDVVDLLWVSACVRMCLFQKLWFDGRTVDLPSITFHVKRHLQMLTWQFFTMRNNNITKKRLRRTTNDDNIVRSRARETIKNPMLAFFIFWFFVKLSIFFRLWLLSIRIDIFGRFERNDK